MVLKTRSLQQDPLENFFSTVRQYGGGNTNPNCYQFVSCIKTALVNNLSSNKNFAKNCEDDDAQLLVNLREFLLHKSHANVVSDSNELLEIQNVVIDSNSFESETTAYVCGFFIKKLDTNCEQCLSAFKSENIEPIHSFVHFKEWDHVKLKLNYCSENLVKCVTHIYDLVKKCLLEYPHIYHIKSKINVLLNKYVDTTFIDCSFHKTEITNKFFGIVVKCIIYKFLQDKQRNFVANNKSKYKKILHLYIFSFFLCLLPYIYICI